MPESLRQQGVQRPLPDVAVGRVAQIMPQGDGLRQILVQPQGPGQGPGHLGNLQRVGQPGPVVIPLRGEKYLGLELQPPKGFAVDDAVPVPLEGGAHIAVRDGHSPAPALRRVGGVGRQQQIFLPLLSFAYGHPAHSLPEL